MTTLEEQARYPSELQQEFLSALDRLRAKRPGHVLVREGTDLQREMRVQTARTLRGFIDRARLVR